jgi:ABC-type polysaccharide/polyol phosphate transport system ATPase subunit
MASISELCDQAIWMHRGEMRMWDEPEPVIDAYTRFLDIREDDAVAQEDV